MRVKRGFCVCWLIIVAAGAAQSAWGTTKGLNQIVTPDIQPKGVLTLSFQEQDTHIGNSNELQWELGLTKRFEVAVFQGFSPPQTILNAEFGVVQKPPFLLSVGFLGWQNQAVGGSGPEPFLEAGYYQGKDEWMAGVLHAGKQYQLILGWGYQTRPNLVIQFDYLSGSGNFTTAGFTYNITPSLQINPAVYLSNDSQHHCYGYTVLTWSVQLWK